LERSTKRGGAPQKKRGFFLAKSRFGRRDQTSTAFVTEEKGRGKVNPTPSRPSKGGGRAIATKEREGKKDKKKKKGGVFTASFEAKQGGKGKGGRRSKGGLLIESFAERTKRGEFG